MGESKLKKEKRLGDLRKAIETPAVSPENAEKLMSVLDRAEQIGYRNALLDVERGMVAVFNSTPPGETELRNALRKVIAVLDNFSRTAAVDRTGGAGTAN